MIGSGLTFLLALCVCGWLPPRSLSLKKVEFPVSVFDRSGNSVSLLLRFAEGDSVHRVIERFWRDNGITGDVSGVAAGIKRFYDERKDLHALSLRFGSDSESRAARSLSSTRIESGDVDWSLSTSDDEVCNPLGAWCRWDAPESSGGVGGQDHKNGTVSGRGTRLTMREPPTCVGNRTSCVVNGEVFYDQTTDTFVLNDCSTPVSTATVVAEAEEEFGQEDDRDNPATGFFSLPSRYSDTRALRPYNFALKRECLGRERIRKAVSLTEFQGRTVALVRRYMPHSAGHFLIDNVLPILKLFSDLSVPPEKRAIVFDDDCQDVNTIFYSEGWGVHWRQMCEKLTPAFAHPLAPSRVFSLRQLTALRLPPASQGLVRLPKVAVGLMYGGDPNGSNGHTYWDRFPDKLLGLVDEFRHLVWRSVGLVSSEGVPVVPELSERKTIAFFYKKYSNRFAVVNHEQVSSFLSCWCERVGFEFVSADLGDLSFAEQVRLLSRTRVLLSAAGSASFGAFHLPDDSSLIYLPLLDPIQRDLDFRWIHRHVKFYHTHRYIEHDAILRNQQEETPAVYPFEVVVDLQVLQYLLSRILASPPGKLRGTLTEEEIASFFRTSAFCFENLTPSSPNATVTPEPAKGPMEDLGAETENDEFADVTEVGGGEGEGPLSVSVAVASGHMGEEGVPGREKEDEAMESRSHSEYLTETVRSTDPTLSTGGVSLNSTLRAPFASTEISPHTLTLMEYLDLVAVGGLGVPKEFFRAQAGQDVFALWAHQNRLPREKGRSNFTGFCVELGAAHPFFFSNGFALEHGFGWGGLLVEFESKYRDLYPKFRPQAKAVIADATSLDYSRLLKEMEAPTDIDFLSLDLEEGNGSTLAVLELFDRFVFPQGYRFAAVAFEHDVYNTNVHDTRKKSREIFARHGYVRVVSDVGVEGAPFEDWYAHPELVRRDKIDALLSQNHMRGKENNVVPDASVIEWQDILLPL